MSSLPASTAKSLAEGEVEFTCGKPVSGETIIIKEFQVEAMHLGSSLVVRKDTLGKIAEGHGVTMSLVRDGLRHRLRVNGTRAQVEAAAQGVHIRVEGARREAAYASQQHQLALAVQAPGGWQCALCHENQYASNAMCFRCAAPKPKPDINEQEDVIRVDQQYIGHVLGKSGSFFKAMQQQSGAMIHLDQGTKDIGFSLIRISNMGSPEHATARFMLLNKIDEAQQSLGRVRMR